MALRGRAAGFAAAAIAALALGAPAASAAPTEDPCPNAEFRTGHSATLPDCLAIELVNMPDKNMNMVQFATLAPSGDRVLYGILGGAEGSPSGSNTYFYADRGPDGWKSVSPVPDRATLDRNGFAPQVPSADVSRFAVLMRANVFTGGGDILMRLGRNEAPATYHHLPQGAASLQAMLGSDDLGVIAGITTNRWAADHPSGSLQLYSYRDDGSGPELIGRLPGPGGAADPVPACGARFTGGSVARLSSRMLSADGSRAFFHSKAGGVCTSAVPWNLYVRIGGLQGETRLISGPALDGVDRGGQFVQATADGSEVFFVSATQLDPADTDTTGDVYRHTVATGENECVTCVADIPANVALGHVDSGALPGAVVAGDGSRVYFSTPDVLGGEGQSGTSTYNLYLVDVASGTLRYVATTDARLISVTSIGGQTATVSTSDGSVLVFRSKHLALDGLTGSQNDGVEQYYRYSARENELVCVSCPPPGLATKSVSVEMIDRGMFSLEVGSPLSGDGSVFAFSSPDPLVEADVNGDSDVYVWRDGVVSLLTDGTTTTGSQTEHLVFGVSPSGRDILFGSAARLSSEVVEGDFPSRQLYVARVGGGFAREGVVSECSGDSCQGALSGGLELAVPATGALFGRGDVAPAVGARVSVALARGGRLALARGGRATVRVRVSRPGRVRVVGRARLGGRVRVVARSSAVAGEAGVVAVGVRLSRPARLRVARGHRLRVALSVSVPGVAGARVLRLGVSRPDGVSRRRGDR